VFVEEERAISYSNNSYDGQRKTLVIFLSQNVDWSPDTEKLFHLTDEEFNPEHGSTRTLCNTRQPISHYTWYEKVTLNKIEDYIEKLVNYPLPPPLDPSLCEHCSEKALKMKGEEERISGDYS
jgi:hypothetical protein